MPSRMDPPDGKNYTIARKSLPPEPSWNRNRLDQLPFYGHRKCQQVQREAHPSVCRLFEIMMRGDRVTWMQVSCLSCMYDTHTTSPYFKFPLPLATHTTPCGDVFMSLQGAPDAPFGFIWGLPVATKAPILVILSKAQSTTPHWHALSMTYLQCPVYRTMSLILYLIRFVFDPRRRILFSSSRHLVVTPRCMCGVLISITKTAYAASYTCMSIPFPVLPCIAHHNPYFTRCWPGCCLLIGSPYPSPMVWTGLLNRSGKYGNYLASKALASFRLLAFLLLLQCSA